MLRPETSQLNDTAPRSRGRTLLAGLTAILAALSIGLGNLTGSQAQEAAPRAVIIFDGSGSMWGRIGEVSKFQIARRTMTSVIPDYADTLAIGLIAYGHRRKGDCNDIQTFAHPARGQTETLNQAFAGMSPRGKTPIASSLEQAASELVEDNGGHIIVLTDGTENCRKDLCKTVVGLRDAAPGLTISVVAFGMRSRDIDKIRCIATDGGGRLIVANNATSLRGGLAGILETIRSGKPLIPDQPEPGAAGTTDLQAAASPPAIDLGRPRLKLRALRAPTGPLLDAPVHWQVTRIDADGTKPVFEGSAPATDVDVTRGRYRIVAKLGSTSATREVNVTADGERSIHIPIEVAQLDLTGAAQLGAGETLTIMPAGSIGTARSAPLVLTRTDDTAKALYLPPGDYILRRDGDVGSRARTVRLKTGDIQHVAFDTSFGELNLRAPMSADGTPATAVVFKVYGKSDADVETEVARSASPRPAFQLPAGTYRVVAEAGYARAERSVEIVTGKGTDVSLPLKAGRLRLSAEDTTGGRLKGPLGYSIVSIGPTADAVPRPVMSTARRSATLTVPSGFYRVTAAIDGTNLTASTDIIVNAGTEESAVLAFTPSRLDLAIENTENALGARNVTWEIRPGGAKAGVRPVWSGRGARATATIAPGSYTIVARSQARQTTRDVELIAGATMAVTVPLP